MKWLADFVDVGDISIKDFAAKMTLSGSKVETIEPSVTFDGVPLDDTTVEFEITNNRPDCLSVRGLAREVAATFGRELRDVGTHGVRPRANNAHPYDVSLTISVENNALCPRYCGCVVTDIKIEPSPQWLQDRLHASGLRPINNIVDITNYVMLEFGQPMHAFDYANVQNDEIIVRTAREGEVLKTLDGKQHKLSQNMLVIADSDTPIGVAGVMGGANSEISENTKTIILESATFDSESIRKTAQSLNMRTDASSRFEKGLDPGNAPIALKRACELIEQLGCGTVAIDFIEVNNADLTLRSMTLECDVINRLLGTDYSRDAMVSALKLLGFGVDGDIVVIPSWRNDVSITADLAEEVARLHDYNTIPRTLNKSGSVGRLTVNQQNARKLGALCRGFGFTETLSFSFYGNNAFDQIGLPKSSPKRDAVRLLNPLGEDTALMRTTLLPSLLDVLRRNESLSTDNCSVYVYDKVYIKNDDILPLEKNHLALGCYGDERDFFDMKGIITALAEAFNLPSLSYAAKSDSGTFHPGRCAVISCNDVELGVMGQLHPALKNKNGLNHDCFLAELNMDVLWTQTLTEAKFSALPRYPSITRDLALVCKQEITNAQLCEAIESAAGELLVGLALFDLYEGSQIKEGMKSLAYTLTLRAPDRTLRDEDADDVIERVLAGCQGLATRR